MSKKMLLIVIILVVILGSSITIYNKLLKNGNKQNMPISYLNSVETKQTLKQIQGDTDFNYSNLEQSQKNAEKVTWIAGKVPNIKISIIKQTSLADNTSNISIDWFIFKNSDIAKLESHAYADVFYSTFDDAIQFAATTPFDQVEKYAGTRESGAKYERYSITKLTDVVAKQQAEIDQKNKVTAACKGQVDFLYTTFNDLRPRQNDPTYKPTVQFTFEELNRCWIATLNDDTRNVDLTLPDNRSNAEYLQESLKIYNAIVAKNQ